MELNVQNNEVKSNENSVTWLKILLDEKILKNWKNVYTKSVTLEYIYKLSNLMFQVKFPG